MVGMSVLVGGGAEICWHSEKAVDRDLRSVGLAAVSRGRQHCYVA